MKTPTNTNEEWVAPKMTLHYVPPLFIPLKKEHFEAFECGKKTIEYRLLGKRWNEKNCHAGREVTLSCGYGKNRRLHAQIAMVVVSPLSSFVDNEKKVIKSVYPSITEKDEIICIFIHLQRKDGGNNE
jgi:hypothetical protein